HLQGVEGKRLDAVDATTGGASPSIGETRTVSSEVLRVRCPGEAACELGSGTNAELGIDLREVRLYRPQAKEQPSRDLLVGEPLGDELGDLSLSRRQRAPVGWPAPRQAADVRGSLLRPAGRSQLVEALERLNERPPSCAPVPRAALDTTAQVHRAGVLERFR